MESQSQNMDKVGEAQLNQTLLLKTTMDIVPQLVEALTGAESGRLRMIKMVITYCFSIFFYCAINMKC